MKTFEYRLYPNKEQYRLLIECLSESRHLYNEMLEKTKSQYEQTGKFQFRYDLNKAFKGRGEHVPATTVQTLSDRLDKALRRYLERKEADPRAGFPRFKNANQWHSIHLRQYGQSKDVWLDADGKHLHVPRKLGKLIKIKLHRPLEGLPKTVHIVLRADGHWYALIICEMPAVEPVEDRPTIGLDVGLKVFLADSEGRTVENPRYYRKSQKTLRRKQRILSRRIKGSRRRRKAAKNVAQTHLKISQQRRDFLFKTAKVYADAYSLIAVEDLNISGMARNGHLAKSIYDASWSKFILILTDKAENAGGRVIKVAPHFTSQMCFRCKTIVSKSLSVRTHICPECGFVEDRDVNAAKNILFKGQGMAFRT